MTIRISDFLYHAPIYDWAGGSIERLTSLSSSIGDFVYYSLIYNWVGGKIDQFSSDVLGRAMSMVSSVMFIMITIWVLLHGYRIVTGQSREPAMVTVSHLLRLSLIVTAATVTSSGAPQLIQFMTDDVSSWINQVVTGNNEDTNSLASSIDGNLAYTQLAMSAVDAVQVPANDTVNAQSLARTELVATLGTGGPAIVAGAMLLLYRVTMALLIGLGPIFILCLIFKPTQDLFRRWLLYLIGTMFSMATLYWVVSIAMQLSTRVAAALWTSSLINSALLGDNAENLSGQAMQQGGVGLILTVLIISTPPMAAMLFNGTLGNFMPYAQVAGGGVGTSHPGPQGQPPGSYAPSTSAQANTEKQPGFSSRPQLGNSQPIGAAGDIKKTV
jgi:type IV secretion system protein VirB6